MGLDAFGNVGWTAAAHCWNDALDVCDDGKPCTAERCAGAQGCIYGGTSFGSCGDGKSCGVPATCK